MHEYDVTLKSLLRGSAPKALASLTGGQVVEWLDGELPKIQNVQNQRMDLLAEMSDKELMQIELQSTNDTDMPVRMAEYALAVYRRFRRFPRQIALYVGEAPVRMRAALSGPSFSFRYELRDIRELDGEELLRSEETGDNV